jgi:hypothetical protein
MAQMKNRVSGLLMETGVSYNKQRLHKLAYFTELMSGNDNVSAGTESTSGSFLFPRHAESAANSSGAFDVGFLPVCPLYEGAEGDSILLAVSDERAGQAQFFSIGLTGVLIKSTM